MPSTTINSRNDSASSPSALAAELLRRTVIDNPFIPITPTVPQALFLTVPCREILYGGAAGGGKSAGLLAGALQYVDVPGYAAVLIRKTYRDLAKPGALMDLSHEWLDETPARWDAQQHQWTFPSGATVNFAHLESSGAHLDHQGAEYQYVGFDELTQLPERQYLYVQGRLRRRAGVMVPLRARSGANPGGPGHEWVKKRFIDAARSLKRMFIPAKLEDNPYLDREAYEESLAELDPVTRAQMRHGNWDVRPEGSLFKREWLAGRIVSDSQPIVRTVRYWDLAATEVGENGNADPDWTVGLLLGITATGLFFILDVVRFRGTALEVKRRMRETAIRDGLKTEIRIEQEGGSAGKIVALDIVRDVLQGFAAYAVKPRASKVERSKPVQAAAERGDVYLVAGPWNAEFLDELCAFGTDTAHDDQVDALSGSYEALAAGSRAWGQREWSKVFNPTPEREVEDVEARIMRRLQGAGTP